MKNMAVIIPVITPNTAHHNKYSGAISAASDCTLFKTCFGDVKSIQTLPFLFTPPGALKT